MSKAFETDKHGYRTRDVDAYIAETKAAMSEQKERIAELKKELAGKDTELKAFKQKQDLIVKSIMNAVQKAEQIEGLIKQKYAAEIAHLNAFHDQWTGYYNKLIEIYPLSAELSGLGQFNKRVSAILTGDNAPEKKFSEARRQFESENARLSKNAQFENENAKRAESQFESESARLAKSGKKYVGFIPVGDDEGADNNAGGGEMDVMSDFNPEESIRQMLRREAAEEERKAAKAAQKASAKPITQKPVPQKTILQNTATNPVQKSAKNSNQRADIKKNPVAATLSAGGLGLSDSGFNFEEALNPTQQLSDILKEIGLQLEEK